MIDDADLEEKIKEFNRSVIQALGLQNGITHHEFFVDANQQITFCEIGARNGGGGIVQAIEQAQTVNLFHANLCLQLGLPLPEIKKTGLYSSYLFFTPQKGRVEEISELTEFEKPWIPLCGINAKKGDVLGEPQNSADLIAHFIVVGESVAELLERVRWIEENFRLVTVEDEAVVDCGN